MRKLLTLVLAGTLSIHMASGQRYSENKTEFRSQAIGKLNAIGTESAKKIAFDFQNAWDGKFTAAQQDKIHEIALTMQQKGHRFYPFFYHYFTYLAFSVAQENLQQQELTNVLEINEQVVRTLPKSEYKEFLFGLNIFFARRYLSFDKTLSVQAVDGSYAFKLLDEYIDIEEENVDSDTSSVIPEDEIPEIISDPNPGGWDNNGWDNSSSGWDNNDSWGTTDDSWGNSSSDWGDDSSNDSGWGSSWDDEPAQTQYEAPKAIRPDFSPITTDYLALKQGKYRHPEEKGPVIEMKSTRLIISTPHDSLNIKNVNGLFKLNDRTFAGSQGSIDWPGQNTKFRGAVVQLKDFHIRKDRSDFWTPNSTLQFSDVEGGDIEGVFEYKSVPRKARTLSGYPIFTSNRGGLSVKLNDENLNYTGGIQLKGNTLHGKSVSRDTGTLTIKDGKGNTVVLRSKDFILGDSLVSMNSGSITIIHGIDSIYHSSVRAKYDLNSKKLLVLRNSNLKPFKSSYFEVSMGVDLVKWYLGRDSIELELMNGKDLLPAAFESETFFDEVRYQKLGRFLDFHPINSAVYYSRQFNVTEFYVGEMALAYGIDERFAKGAGKILSQYGFANYNPTTGLLKLYPKAFHYYDASAQKVDFDNLMIPSKMPNGANAVVKLDSGKLEIKGVSRFYLTTDFKIYAAPFDSTVTLLKGRDLEFDGDLHAGDFDYQGTGHKFSYSEFSFKMPQIDSMRITVPLQDTTKVEEGFKKTELDNQITSTSGTLFIDKAENKSGVKKNSSYPYFASNSDAVVYFDGYEILGGAYDKSVRFFIPPFKLDSIEREDGESISFEGTFNSGGIFPTFAETLHVQEDESLGFKHQIPSQGYNLYGTEARTYEEIRLSNKGMRGYGQIDFLSTTIYSNDFIYYPDSVTTDGTSGVISPGTYRGASYPEAVLGAFDMYWLPRKDSMYLHTVNEPFKFYNSTASLDGFANITTKGVYGGGTLFTRGSKAVSEELTFKELEYSARHAHFEVLTNDPLKPAMEGDDIRLDFDLTSNTAVIQPQKRGVAAISFPYAQMKTSITQAVWDLEDSIVTMTKPPEVPLEDSYFFTTRKELDSLAFNAETAVYDINTQELNVKGIPYIIVADSKIIPEGNETTILANSELQEFKNAEIIIDTLNGYHYLDRANIRVISRLKFEGNAFYQQIVEKDTFDIRFDSFELKEVPVGEPNKKGIYEQRLMTVSGGEVLEKQNLIISAGFLYKGGVTMYASKPALELNGSVKLMLDDEAHDNWVMFERKEGEKEVAVPFDNAVFESGERVSAGIHVDIRDELFTTFVEPKESGSSLDFFRASGVLTFIDSIQTYRIESSDKTAGNSYQGHTMMYEDATKSIIFEGIADFIDPTNEQLSLDASLLGVGNKETNEYSADVMFAMDFPAPEAAFDIMADDLIDIIERVGPPLANDISLELLYKLANLTNDATAKKYENESLKDYTSLFDVSKELERQLLLSGVKMQWDISQKAWYNKTKLAISNIYKDDINAKLDGFLEIKKDESGADVVNLFIQAAPGVWYYIGYTSNQLILYSSNEKFNELIQSKTNADKSKPGELILALGDTNETLGFINDFRKKYFGLDEPYNLVSPDEIDVEDENFDTIEEEEDDDGFGFE